MKKLFCCACLCVSLAQVVFANPTSNALPIDIEAEHLSYSQDQRFMEASGNVLVSYDDYVITANYLWVDMLKQQARFDGGFSFMRNKRAIMGQTLFYDIAVQEGLAKDVTVVLENIRVNGNSLVIKDNKAQLTNSALTSCDLLEPHYKVTAANTTIYLKWGLLVSSSGIFWLGDKPVMFVPSYIVGDPRYGYQIADNAPLPQIGSDAVNGSYVKERINVYADERNTGTALLEWYSKNGWLLGFQHDWRKSPNSFGNTRLKFHTNEGLEGGVLYHFLLTDEQIDNSVNLIEQFFNSPDQSKPALAAQLELSAGEIYKNDRDLQRVSLLPQLTLTVPLSHTGIRDVDYTAMFQFGNILEENKTDPKQSLSRARIVSGLNYYWHKSLPAEVQMELMTGYLGRWYWEGVYLTNSWNLIDGELTFKKDLLPFEAQWRYHHKYLNSGGSAFSFDSKEFVLDDEIIYDLGLNIHQNKLIGVWRYNLGQQVYRDIDITLQLNEHCLNLLFTWRQVRQEFNFGVSLN